MTVTKHPLVLLFLILTLVMPVLAADSIKEEIPYGNNPQTGHYASVNGIEMYYETYGSGDPLLVIHGNGQSIADMHFQIAHFSRDYKVIVSDSRAHGKSGRGEGRLTYMQMLEDYNALLGQLNITGADVFGWSDGGILALLLAIHHPDKVNKLAVMGANLRPGQSAIEAWVPGLLDPLSEVVDGMIASKDSSEDWQHQRRMLDLLMTQPNIPLESLHKIKVPVLVMAGDKDIIRSRHSLEIFENLPRAHMAILPGQTHWAPATDPDGFNALLEKFFSTPYARPTSEEILTAELGSIPVKPGRAKEPIE